jgi:hypothetical protein
MHEQSWGCAGMQMHAHEMLPMDGHVDIMDIGTSILDHA